MACLGYVYWCVLRLHFRLERTELMCNDVERTAMVWIARTTRRCRRQPQTRAHVAPPELSVSYASLRTISHEVDADGAAETTHRTKRSSMPTPTRTT